MTEIALTYMPELPALFRLETNVVQPWVQGFAPPIFTSYWKYLDVDQARRGQGGADGTIGIGNGSANASNAAKP